MRTFQTLLFLLYLPACYAANTPVEGSIKAGGFHIQYSDTGAGEPLLFVHGGMQDRHMWNHQVNFFIHRHYRVITFDLPAHGQSSGTDTTLLVSELIRILLDSLKIKRASIVGLSLGSVCVTAFVIAHPERVNKVVLASPGLIGSTALLTIDSLSLHLYNQIDSVLASGDCDEYARLFVSSWCVGPLRDSSKVPVALRRNVYETTRYNCKEHSRSEWRPFGSAPVMPVLHTIQKPVLLISGDQDVPFNNTISTYMQSQIPSSRVYIIKNAAHMVNMEKPEPFNKLVLEFLMR
jgi:pimeloyl-ACP methyl ester carboxylesterase